MGNRILTIQKKAAELGRLRTGYSEPGNGKRRLPVKSATWILSSHSREYVEAAAALWGGEPEEWQPQGDGQMQWRVITETPSLDALLPPGDPLATHHELWTKGGCARRCDGVTEQMSRRPCLCAAQFGEFWYLQAKGTVCSITTRLNVLLPEMPDLGVWRAETHSFYAASEQAGQVDTVLAGTGGKGVVPVRLTISQRKVVRNGQTKNFPVVMVVPRLPRLRHALAGPISTAAALDPAAMERPAIEAPRPDYVAEAKAGLTPEDVGDVWRRARDAGHLTDELRAELTRIAGEIKDEPVPAPAFTRAAPDDEPVDAEIVPDDQDGDSA